MTYEQAMSELESIVTKLSNDQVKIEEGLTLYKQAIDYAKIAMDELNRLKGSIELLNKDMSKLEVFLEEADVDDDDDDDDE